METQKQKSNNKKTAKVTAKVTELPVNKEQDSRNIVSEMENRIKRLFDGLEKPPSDFVAYLLEGAQQVREELVAISEEAVKTRTQLQNLDKSALQLQGAYNKTIQDIANWLKKHDDVVGPAVTALPHN